PVSAAARAGRRRRWAVVGGLLAGLPGRSAEPAPVRQAGGPGGPGGRGAAPAADAPAAAGGSARELAGGRSWAHRAGGAGRSRSELRDLIRLGACPAAAGRAGGRRVWDVVRADGRSDDELREVRITRGYQDWPPGSVLVEFGRTRVLCAATVQEGVPRWRAGS